MKHNRILIILAAVLLSSCAGTSVKLGEDDVTAFTEALNGGKTDALADMSELPFAFDGEILSSDSQIRLLWNGLAGQSYILDDPEILDMRQVKSKDASLFSSSWEMNTFFRQILKEKDMLVQLKSGRREVYLILRPDGGGTQLLAFREADQ